MEFGPHLSEISHIKFVSTIKLNTFKVNGPHFADIFLPLLLKSTKKWRLAHNFRKKLKIFFSTNKTVKKMAFGSFFMKVFYFFLNKRKEISKSGCILTV